MCLLLKWFFIIYKICRVIIIFRSHFLPPSLVVWFFFIVFTCENILPQKYSGYLQRIVLALWGLVPLFSSITKDCKLSSVCPWAPKLGLCFDLDSGEMNLSPSTTEKNSKDQSSMCKVINILNRNMLDDSFLHIQLNSKMSKLCKLVVVRTARGRGWETQLENSPRFHPPSCGRYFQL